MEQQTMLRAPITLAELEVTVKHFKSNKTPGCDGIPAEFYQKFFSIIRPILLDVYKYAEEQGHLHISARRDILSLMPKKDHDLLLLKNWHPLTLLTLDYKIWAKTLDNRLKEVLPTLIEGHQTGLWRDGIFWTM